MQSGSACSDAIAYTYIRGGPEAPHLFGEVRFYQERGCVLISANIAGLLWESGPGFFALHIHEGKDCSGESFSNTGGHYNPANATHPTYAGDLTPLMLCNGGAYLVMRTEHFCVREIIGRTVVIHSGPDDFHSQPFGNAGTITSAIK